MKDKRMSEELPEQNQSPIFERIVDILDKAINIFNIYLLGYIYP